MHLVSNKKWIIEHLVQVWPSKYKASLADPISTLTTSDPRTWRWTFHLCFNSCTFHCNRAFFYCNSTFRIETRQSTQKSTFNCDILEHWSCRLIKFSHSIQYTLTKLLFQLEILLLTQLLPFYLNLVWKPKLQDLHSNWIARKHWRKEWNCSFPCPLDTRYK